MLLRELARWSGTAASPIDMIWEQTITPQGRGEQHAWQCEVGDGNARERRRKRWGKIQSTIGSALRSTEPEAFEDTRVALMEPNPKMDVLN